MVMVMVMGTPKTKRVKEEEEVEMLESSGGGGESQSQPKSRRRTRSEVAPEWTTQESLILVNEISAVEFDCLDTLSSYQKWKIIVQNCNALDVHRSLNQCRRHWDSLLSRFTSINSHWHDCQTPEPDYWSLGADQRAELGLPTDFDAEVFKALDDHLKARDVGSDSEVDNDPEASEPDPRLNNTYPLLQFGSKKQSRKVAPWKHRIGEKIKPQKHSTCGKIKMEKSGVALKTETATYGTYEEVMPGKRIIEEGKEQMMAARICGNAELIYTILGGELTDNINYKSANLKRAGAFGSVVSRRQGDKLIAGLGNLTDTLSQLCHLIQ